MLGKDRALDVSGTVVVVIVETGFAQSDYLGGPGKSGELFKMVSGYAACAVRAKTDSGADVLIAPGKFDGVGGVFEALAYGEQAGQAGDAGAVQDGWDVLTQFGRGEVAVGISEAG